MYDLALGKHDRAAADARRLIAAADKVHLDSSVFNPARIWKFYGTLAAKGDSIPSRPHRVSRILEIPTPLEVVR